MSSGIIDLRPGRSRRPPRGQQPLFSPRAQPPRRPLPLRSRRRRMRLLIIVLIVLCALGAAYGVSYLSYLPALSIQKVTVVGASDVDPSLIETSVNGMLDDGSYRFLSRKNILLYPKQQIEQKLPGSFPRIASASLSRPSFFSTELIVTVSERKAFALWCDAECYLMDSGGFLYAEAGSTTIQYVFRGGITGQPIGQSFTPAHLPGLIALLTQLGQAGYSPLGVTIENDTDMSVPLSQGFFLKASFGENADTLVSNLRLVLNSAALAGKVDHLEYVDLRFGDRVYYKLKGEEQQSQ